MQTRWNKELSKKAVAAKAKWRLQLRDLEHGDSLTLRLYKLPWPARYAGGDGTEYSAA